MRPILVTGAAKGFGAEICRRLALLGHDIVIHYRRSEKEAMLLVEECRAHGVLAQALQGDFATAMPAFITTYLRRFPHTKGVVHNVGNYLVAPSSQTKEEEWRGLFETNFFAPLTLTQALLPALIQAKGSIVTIGTSGLTANRALTSMAAYATTKSALLFYTRSLAKELAPSQVTVNMVSPGYLETAVDLAQAPPLPMGRPAFLREAAEAVAFFFEENNHYITGQNIEVAGGFGL